ncbi:MAG TPA: hypothetical protein VFY96_07500 [Candidatus Binatia bacterium]|nr:hypothetical protein [Candidatus Binatia bacterium]
MTFTDILQWCRQHHAVVRGVYRGGAISISHEDKELPAEIPAFDDIFHWGIDMPELKHYVSGSDFERMVTGKLTIDGFKSSLRGRE